MAVSIRVTDIIKKWDMRKTHDLRHHRKAKKLNKGECIIAFNSAQTMARIIDFKGGVHTYYCDDRQIFDLDTIRILVKSAFFVDLTPGQTARQRAEELWLAA